MPFIVLRALNYITLCSPKELRPFECQEQLFAEEIAKTLDRHKPGGATPKSIPGEDADNPLLGSKLTKKEILAAYRKSFTKCCERSDLRGEHNIYKNRESMECSAIFVPLLVTSRSILSVAAPHLSAHLDFVALHHLHLALLSTQDSFKFCQTLHFSYADFSVTTQRPILAGTWRDDILEILRNAMSKLFQLRDLIVFDFDVMSHRWRTWNSSTVRERCRFKQLIFEMYLSGKDDIRCFLTAETERDQVAEDDRQFEFPSQEEFAAFPLEKQRLLLERRQNLETVAFVPHSKTETVFAFFSDLCIAKVLNPENQTVKNRNRNSNNNNNKISNLIINLFPTRAKIIPWSDLTSTTGFISQCAACISAGPKTSLSEYDDDKLRDVISLLPLPSRNQPLVILAEKSLSIYRTLIASVLTIADCSLNKGHPTNPHEQFEVKYRATKLFQKICVLCHESAIELARRSALGIKNDSKSFFNLRQTQLAGLNDNEYATTTCLNMARKTRSESNLCLFFRMHEISAASLRQVQELGKTVFSQPGSYRDYVLDYYLPAVEIVLDNCFKDVLAQSCANNVVLCLVNLFSGDPFYSSYVAHVIMTERHPRSGLLWLCHLMKIMCGDRLLLSPSFLDLRVLGDNDDDNNNNNDDNPSSLDWLSRNFLMKECLEFADCLLTFLLRIMDCKGKEGFSEEIFRFLCDDLKFLAIVFPRVIERMIAFAGKDCYDDEVHGLVSALITSALKTGIFLDFEGVQFVSSAVIELKTKSGKSTKKRLVDLFLNHALNIEETCETEDEKEKSFQPSKAAVASSNKNNKNNNNKQPVLKRPAEISFTTNEILSFFLLHYFCQDFDKLGITLRRSPTSRFARATLPRTMNDALQDENWRLARLAKGLSSKQFGLNFVTKSFTALNSLSLTAEVYADRIQHFFLTRNIPRDADNVTKDTLKGLERESKQAVSCLEVVLDRIKILVSTLCVIAGQEKILQDAYLWNDECDRWEEYFTSNNFGRFFTIPYTVYYDQQQNDNNHFHRSSNRRNQYRPCASFVHQHERPVLQKIAVPGQTVNDKAGMTKSRNGSINNPLKVGCDFPVETMRDEPGTIEQIIGFRYGKFRDGVSMMRQVYDFCFNHGAMRQAFPQQRGELLSDLEEILCLIDDYEEDHPQPVIVKSENKKRKK